MNRFQLVDDHRDLYEVKRLREVLKINRSSYYTWKSAAPARRRRLVDDAVLRATIKTVCLPRKTVATGRNHVSGPLNGLLVKNPGNILNDMAEIGDWTSIADATAANGKNSFHATRGDVAAILISIKNSQTIIQGRLNGGFQDLPAN